MKSLGRIAVAGSLLGATACIARSSSAPQPVQHDAPQPSAALAPPGVRYTDPDLPIDVRVRDLVGRMTREEKIRQLGTDAPAIERLGVPAYRWWNEALHGVAWRKGVTVFPQAIGLAATWDPELLHRVATAISVEVRALYNQGEFGLTLFTPVINIARDPRWGRTQEGYGEDPFLVGRLAAAYVKGIQGDDPVYFRAIATPKHFALNNTEKTRHTGSSNAPEDEIMDYYLPHFRAAVVEGGAFSVMCAYNRVNGVPACASDWLLGQILRHDWGFKGFVVTDCDAINDMVWGHKTAPNHEQAAAAALKAGTDLNCGDTYQKHLAAAIDQGLTTEADVDRALTQLFIARFRLGMFDPPTRVPYSRIGRDEIDSPAHRAVAAEAAAESLVLLKNDGTLPLNPGKIKSLAVIGPAAGVMLRGSSGYHGLPSAEVTIREGIEHLAGGRFKVVVEPGVMLSNGEGVPVVPIPATALSTRSGGRTVPGLSGEYFSDRDFRKIASARVDATIAMDWAGASPMPGVPNDDFSVRWTGKLTAPKTGRYVIRLTSDDGSRLSIDGKRVIDDWGDHAAQARSVAVDLAQGRAHDVVLEYYEHQGVSSLRLEWGTLDAGVARAVAAARSADAVVFVAGVDETASDEEHDFLDLEIPADQRALLDAVFRANPHTVVVLQSGNPVLLHDAALRVPALLQAWYPGQDTGNAVAGALFGSINPSGKLPLTFYASLAQLPPMDDYDIRHGRTYQYFTGTPTFAFGHGLGYSPFAYGKLALGPDTVKPSDTIHVAFELENAGARRGTETAQVYVADATPNPARPRQRLVGFRRVTLDPHSGTTVTLDVPVAELGHWDVTSKRYVVDPGRYEFRIGASSADLRLRGPISVGP